MKQSVFDKIKKLTMFTMTESFEKDDTCIGIYKKSLLYLIRGALEARAGGRDPRSPGVPEARPGTRRPPRQAGSGAKAEVMWSQTVGGGPRTSSCSTTHGGFDNDAATMNSLARRVIDNDRLTAEFGTAPGTRGLAEEVSPWPSEEQARDYIASRQGPQRRPPGGGHCASGSTSTRPRSDQLARLRGDARPGSRSSRTPASRSRS